jgi:uncharacterized repeat protein (TIGR01451 family)
MISRLLTASLLLPVILSAGCETSRWGEGRGDTPRVRSSADVPGDRRSDRSREDDALLSEAMAFPTGSDSTSSLRVEKTMPREVPAGSEFKYEITVTNISSVPLDGVVVYEDVADTMRLVGSEPSVSEGAEDGRLAWRLGNLAPRESRTIAVTASAGEEGTIESCVTATFRPAICLSSAIVRPQLQLGMEAPGAMILCDPLVLRFRVANTGTGTIQGTTIVPELPEGLAFDQRRAPAELEVGPLGPGESRVVEVPVRAEAAGRYEVLARAEAPGGMTSEASPLVVAVEVPQLELAIRSPEQHYLGTPVEFQISVRNSGRAPAAKTVVSTRLPQGVDVNRESLQGARVQRDQIVWDLGTLQPGEERTLDGALAFGQLGQIPLEVRASAACAQEATASAQTNVDGMPALLLEVVDAVDPVPLGGETSYIIRVLNQGTKEDRDIQLMVEVPEAARLLETTGATRAEVEGQTVRFAPLATLPPGERAEWRVRVAAEDAADTQVRIEMVSGFLKRPVIETESTRFFESRHPAPGGQAPRPQPRDEPERPE